jgi:hypothetical protein
MFGLCKSKKRSQHDCVIRKNARKMREKWEKNAINMREKCERNTRLELG